jgi:Zn-dependent protease
MYEDHYIYNPVPQGKIRFGKTEIRHIAIALAVLTIAFTNVLAPMVNFKIQGDVVMIYLYALIISFVVVTAAFFTHEMAHKLMAQRQGAWAEFRMFPLGLIMAFVFSFMGLIFAAPGAVYIQGVKDSRQNGIISFAGPAVNLILGVPFMAVAFLFNIGGILGLFIFLMGYINVFLAFFNMLPIPPLDGSKIFRWNPIIYVSALVTSIVFVAIPYILGWPI